MQIRPDKISLFYPDVTEAQIQAAVDTLRTKWIGQGPKVDAFEQAFVDKFQVPYAVSVNSGSAALETAYDLCDLQPGDEVITTPFTCTATNIPLLRKGVKLLWADIRKDTLNIDMNSVMDLFQKNHPKAIVNVHLGGIESNLPEFVDDNLFNIPVIDDCAQALGIWRPQATFSAYSFQAIKHITTGDGGMFVTKDPDLAHKAKLLRWFGIDRELKQANDWQAYKGRLMTFDIQILGYKRHMNDIAASLGLAGLDDYDNRIAQRKQIFDIYRTIKVDGFTLIDALPGEQNVYWTAGCLVERRDDFAKKMLDLNIETNVIQVRNDLYTIFGGIRQDLPNMNEIEDKYIYIPLHNKMTVDDALYIKAAIEEGW